MRQSKSFKLLNQSSNSFINPHHHKRGENRLLNSKICKKQKRNSTGNMEMNLLQKSLQKQKEKKVKMKDKIFKKIEISKCEPIPQVQTPTLIDKSIDYHRNKVNQERRQMGKKSLDCMSGFSKQCRNDLQKTPKYNSIIINQQNNVSTSKNKHARQKDNELIRSSNDCERNNQPFLEHLTKYIVTLSNSQTSQTYSRAYEHRNSNSSNHNLNQNRICWILESKIEQSEKIKNAFIRDSHRKEQELLRSIQKQAQIKNYLFVMLQKLEKIKQMVTAQRKQRKYLQSRIKQYSLHYLKDKAKSYKKFTNIYQNVNQKIQYDEYQQQIQYHHRENMSHKKNKKYSPDKTQINQSKKRYTQKKIQQLLNYNFDSDQSNQ